MNARFARSVQQYGRPDPLATSRLPNYQLILSSLSTCIVVLAFGSILLSKGCRPHEEISDAGRDPDTEVTGDESKRVRLVGTIRFPHSWLAGTGIGIPMTICFEERGAWASWISLGAKTNQGTWSLVSGLKRLFREEVIDTD